MHRSGRGPTRSAQWRGESCGGIRSARSANEFFHYRRSTPTAAVIRGHDMSPGHVGRRPRDHAATCSRGGLLRSAMQRRRAPCSRRWTRIILAAMRRATDATSSPDHTHTHAVPVTGMVFGYFKVCSRRMNYM